jgi:hypothetical protein
MSKTFRLNVQRSSVNPADPDQQQHLHADSAQRATAGRDVDQKPRPAPSLVLVGVDVERRAPDLVESHVIGRCRQLAVLEADRGAAVAAAARLVS